MGCLWLSHGHTHCTTIGTACASCNAGFYKHTDGTHVRSIGRAGQAPDGVRTDWPHEVDERRSSAPGEFNGPSGVAIGHGRLIVSEEDGKRIQVLTLEGELPEGYVDDGEEH